MKNKILIISLLFACIVQAQEKELTLKEALQFALENKADAKKAKLQVENTSHQIAEVRAMALPQVTLNGGVTYNPILQKSALPGDLMGHPGTTVLVAFGQKWNSTASVGLTQTLFNQSIFVGLKVAQTTREFYEINEQLTEEQLIQKIATSYYQVYVYQQKLKIAEDNLASAIKVRDIVKGRVENGLSKRIDLDRLEVKVSNLESTKQQLINSTQLQENTLKFFIGMPIEQSIKLPENTIIVSQETFTNQLDFSNRSELTLLKKQEQLLEFQRKSNLAEYYPTLSLSANYGYQGLGNIYPWFKLPADGVNWSDYSNIALNLKVPVFNGFSTRSKARQAAISIQKNKEDIKDKELSLSYDFQNAKTQFNNSLININSQEKNVELASEVLRDTKNNYLNGLATLTELLDGETALNEAQNNYTAAQLDYKLAEIEIIKSKGELKKLLN